jgi:hypothetical protein
MTCKPLLVVAAFLALSGPAVAESIYVDTGWVGSSSTDYELVDEAERILLARAVATRGDQVRFKVEEAIKGGTGKSPWLDMRADAMEDTLYLLFMKRDEDNWVLSNLGFLEVDDWNRDWVRVLRYFGRISDLDDEAGEKKALRDLRDTALADPDRHPKTLVRLIDLHFGTPSPGKPFSDLMDLYDAAATDGERLDVLRALRDGEHPETVAFFRGLLLGGEPLWLMEPVLEWMNTGDYELPLLKDLARVWLGHPWEDRTELLALMIQNAGLEDDALLWSLMPAADMAEKGTILDHVLGGKEPNPFADKLRLLPDDPLTADLFLLWISQDASSVEAQFRLGELLRKSETRAWGSVASLEELLSTFEASQEPVERREILTEVVRRIKAEDLAVLWRLLRQASLREAEALLHVVPVLAADEEKLAALYRGASGEEEKNRALWLLLAVHGRERIGRLLSAAGVLGAGSTRLESVARAFLTCPSEEVRLNLAAHLAGGLAAASDFLTMLKILGGANLAEARKLAPWFTRHPGPEALSLLWRLPIPSLHEDLELAEALSASGDHEVLDMALDLRHRVTTDSYHWAFRILAQSPLPAAMEEARCILEEEGYAWLQLMVEIEEENNANPWREWYLQEIASSETVDEVSRERALTYLEQLSLPEASPRP